MSAPRNPPLFDPASSIWIGPGSQRENKPFRTEITLRDMFAAAALAGLFNHRSGTDEEMALRAYSAAEAMLRAREKEKA